MMTHNGGWEGLVLRLELGLGREQEWRKEGLYRGKRGVEEVGGREKSNRMNQTTLPYVNL